MDAIAQQATVGLQLGLTRTAQADPPFLALQVRPAAHQASRQMAQLRQLNLQLTFMGTRPLGEDIQNQPGAIDDAALAQTFQVALLRWRQRVVEQHDGGLGFSDGLGNFLRLAFADKIFGMGSFAATGNYAQRLYAGGGDQRFKLAQIFAIFFLRKIDMNQYGLFTGFVTSNKGGTSQTA